MYSFCFEAKVLLFRQKFSENQFSNRNYVDSSVHERSHSTWPPISKCFRLQFFGFCITMHYPLIHINVPMSKY